MVAGKKKVKRRPGDVIAVPLGHGMNGYGRVLTDTVAFYDLQSREPVAIEVVVALPILFNISVMDYAITRGRWSVLGNLPLEHSLLTTPMFIAARTDPATGGCYMTPDGSQLYPATFEQVKDLELLAVWEPEHVEERLRDHFAGRPNIWVETYKLW